MSHTIIKACECPDLNNAVLKALVRTPFNGAPYVETIALDLCQVYYDPEWEKNQIRQAGTQQQDKEAILEDLRLGIRYNQTPPIIIFNDEKGRWELKDGFHRFWSLLQLNQKRWIFDVHKYDISESFSPKTYSIRDIDEDLKLGANGIHPPSKSASDKDFIGVGIEKVKRGSVPKTKKGIRKWIKSVPNNFSKNTQETIMTNIYKATVSAEYIKSLDLTQAKNIIQEKTIYTTGGKVDTEGRIGRVVNASNDLYTLRAFKMLLQDYVKHGRTTNYIFYSSSALDAKEVREEREQAKAAADSFHNLCIDYAAKFNKTGVKPYNIVGALAQIKKTEKDMVLVPFVEKGEDDSTIIKKDMTENILRKQYSTSTFTSEQAFDAVRDERYKVSDFKNERSFQGTIRRELQCLRDEGTLKFVRDGVYRFN